jgi:hypothetical protein
MARMDRPETVSEYLEFERVRNGYERNGLCDLCAVQASYGHQHGFRVVLSPCRLTCIDPAAQAAVSAIVAGARTALGAHVTTLSAR